MKHERQSILGMSPFRTTQRCRSCLRHADGFSLIELMLAVSIVGVLAALAVPNYMEFIEKARVARAISELHGLAKDVKGFALAVGTYPNSLTDVGVGTRLDPWGTPYQYYRINCGTIDDITSLAKLKLRRKNSPRVIPANFPISDHDSHILLISGAGGGAGAGGGGGPPCGGVEGARKDRFLVPINSDFDIYSRGKNGTTVVALTPPQSQDDVIRASDGGFYGLARNF